MKDTLSTKLQTILVEFDNTEFKENQDFVKFNEAKARILQAFEESGYIDASGMLEVSHLLARQAAEVLKMTEIMTRPVFKLVTPRTKDA